MGYGVTVGDKCSYRDLTPRPALELLREAEERKKKKAEKEKQCANSQ